MITAIFCLIFYICHKNCPESITRNITELTAFVAGLIIDFALEAIGIVYILNGLGFI